MARRIVLRQAETPGDDGSVLSVSRAEAGWEWISFTVWRLAAGQEVKDETAGEEVGLVVLGGRVTVATAGERWEGIGGRADMFAGKPDVVYLPPGMAFTLAAVTDCEVARAGARAERGAAPRLIRAEEIGEEIRGEGNARRTIRHLLEADRPAEHLFLVEAITPNGNWSSFPPHKHDTDDPPRETYLEETYYHRIQPRQGFGFQRIYSANGELDEAVVIEDGTLVLVPEGYHPTVVAPGYDLYYLNVMAGPVRAWHFTNDPDHAWVAESWKPYAAPAPSESRE